MGTARPVMEECFHQPLFALPKGSERCWGTLPSVVQRKPPHAKMLSPELFKTFLWKPNASTGRGLQPPCPAAPPPPPGAVSPSLTTANGAACTEAPRRGSHRPTQAEGALTPPSQNRVQTQREETPPPVSSTPSAGGGGHTAQGGDICPQCCTGHQPAWGHRVQSQVHHLSGCISQHDARVSFPSSEETEAPRSQFLGQGQSVAHGGGYLQTKSASSVPTWGAAWGAA